MPLRDPTCKLKTCKNSSQVEFPSWVRVWQYWRFWLLEISLTFLWILHCRNLWTPKKRNVQLYPVNKRFIFLFAKTSENYLDILLFQMGRNQSLMMQQRRMILKGNKGGEGLVVLTKKCCPFCTHAHANATYISSIMSNFRLRQ